MKDFYNMVLNLEVLGDFKEHDRYNGIYLGKPGYSWHIEFTESEKSADHTFDDDDILVFYPPTVDEYKSILGNIQQYHISVLEPRNPYWKTHGVMIQDPDGHKIVVSNLKSF